MENEKLHWTARPFCMLALVLAAEFALHLVRIGIALPLGLAGSADAQGAAYALSLLLGALLVVVPLGLAFLFWRLVRRAQASHGEAQEVSWKIGAAFWVGVPLALALVPSLGLGYVASYPLTAVLYLLSALSSGLVTALFFSLLFPVAEKRFGAVSGALLIAAGFAVILAVESVVTKAVSGLEYSFVSGGAGDYPVWRGFAESLFSAFITAASLYLLRSALYLAASRRMPGAWLLFACVPSLVTLLYRVLASDIPGTANMSGWLEALCLQFPYYLLVFAISLGVVAGFRRWKTFGAFASDVVRMARRSQNDIEE